MTKFLKGLTKIGDELTVVIYADDGGAGYDMMVKNCFAHDDRNNIFIKMF